MDETTKIFIGTISGFLIAFFAEPVKIYFQNRSKLNHLRIALYKEVAQNYFILSQSLYEFRNYKSQSFFITGMPLLSSDCYKFMITQETTLFYQLNEARFMNTFYRLLGQLMSISNPRSKIMSMSWDQFIQMILQLVAESLLDGFLERKIFQKVTSKKDVESVLREAKKEI